MSIPKGHKPATCNCPICRKARNDVLESKGNLKNAIARESLRNRINTAKALTVDGDEHPVNMAMIRAVLIRFAKLADKKAVVVNSKHNALENRVAILEEKLEQASTEAPPSHGKPVEVSEVISEEKASQKPHQELWGYPDDIKLRVTLPVRGCPCPTCESLRLSTPIRNQYLEDLGNQFSLIRY